ncbi:MAG TPA: ABC transporter ATP-binding protein [Candidatus Bathyarchaeia archaeon]|nr:ABC transporter ATP-binding protein [Candidatus Bathyarchaeia archaeon]
MRKEYSLSGGYFSQKKILKAIDGVDLSINRGDTIGIVGESGAGKTTLGRLILRLIRPTAGSVEYDGKDIIRLAGRELEEFRKKAQIVFQSPFLSLNPSIKIFDTLAEPMRYHKIVDSKESAKSRVKDLLNLVGLDDGFLGRYPHELSGGQMQRIAIARALSVEAEFLVFDEPTSSLDVSAQGQILNLIRTLKNKLNLTYLFVSHNLAIVSNVCSKVGVMYAGKMVELANTDQFFTDPKHPYSQILLNSILTPQMYGKGERALPKGEPPSLVHPPDGCRFHPRCPQAMPLCSQREPKLANLDNTRKAACFLYPEVMVASN